MKTETKSAIRKALETHPDVEFKIECQPEDIPIRGNALASGDEAEDRRAEDAIIADLESGNEWAWCCVKVSATYRDFEGSDYLGGCSYKSEEDFTTPGGYYDDMKAQALDHLAEIIIGAKGDISDLLEGV